MLFQFFRGLHPPRQLDLHTAQQKLNGSCPYDTGATYVQTMGLDMGVLEKT